jgi:argininosuccinate lyase
VKDALRIFAAMLPEITVDAARMKMAANDARGSLAKRTAVGAASPENVADQIARWKSLL